MIGYVLMAVTIILVAYMVITSGDDDGWGG